MMKSKDAEKCKQLRMEAKGIIESLKSAGVEATIFAEEEKTLTKAKHQCLKWALGRFLAHPKIRVLTEEGKGIRASMAGVWKLDALDEAFLSYLGTEDKDTIDDIMKLDTPADGKRKKQPGLSEHPKKVARKA